MSQFGQFALLLSLCLSLVAALVLGAMRKGERTQRVGANFMGAAALSALLSLLALALLLLSHDYRVQYVFEYADHTMSAGYLLAAVWGGQHGSLLFWAALQALFGAAAAAWTQRREPDLGQRASCLLALYQAAFLLLVLTQSNPFAPLELPAVPADGHGMNPLLRNPFMLAHPPALFLGFAAFSVPMAFGTAALLRPTRDDAWLSRQRPWILGAWGLLTAGNLLGMVWAYAELGWGGYWGWDPVENASLMPWLTATALLHAALSNRRRAQSLRWAHLLIILTFALILFGTFLTRSAIVQSVHAFAGATIGPWLLALLTATTAAPAALLIYRRRALAPHYTAAFGSRDWMFGLTHAFFLFSALLVGLATLWPVIAAWLYQQQTAIPASLYNRWMTPFGLAILALMAICTAIPFRPKPHQPPRLFWLALLAALGLGAFWAHRTLSPHLETPSLLPAAAVGLVAAATLSLLRGLRRWVRRPSQDRIAAWVAHAAVVSLFAGFAGNAYARDTTVLVSPGDTAYFEAYRLRFLGLRADETADRQRIAADLHVRLDHTDRGVLSPSRDYYRAHPSQPRSEVGVLRSLGEDLFVVLGDVEPDTGRAVLKVQINPMVTWVWVGGVLLVLSALLALVPVRAFRSLLMLSPRTALRAPAVAWGALVLATGILLFALYGLPSALAGTGMWAVVGMGVYTVRALLALAEERSP